MNALLAGPDGVLDINDAATRARIKAARIAHYTNEFSWAEDALLRFRATNGRSGVITDAALRTALEQRENVLARNIETAR